MTSSVKSASAIPLRVVHLYMKLQHYRFERYLSFLEQFAAWGYNAVLVEYEDMFPYSCRAIRHRPDAWTNKQLQQFVQTADQLKLSVIPLVQTFGHLGFAMLPEAHRSFAEDPSEQGGIVESICPSNPGAVAMVRQMVDDVIAVHPNSEMIHLGGDEALLGVCRRCRPRATRLGKGRFYAQHMNPLIEQVAATGRKPIVWADCLEHHPDGLEALDRRAILCDWFYETGSMRQSWVHVRAGDYLEPTKRGAVRGCPSIVTSGSMPQVPAALRKQLQPHWDRRSGPGGVDTFDGFPYLKMLKQAGFEVMYACAMRTAGHDNRYMVDYDQHLANCDASTQAVAVHKARGVVVTNWQVCGFGAFEDQFLGLFLAAQMALKPGELDVSRAAGRYECKRFGEAIGLLDIYRRLMALSHKQIYAFNGERFEPSQLDPEMLALVPSPLMFNRMQQLESIRQLMGDSAIDSPEIELVEYAADELLYRHELALAWHGRRVTRVAPNLSQLKRRQSTLKRKHRQLFVGRYTPWCFRMDQQLRFANDFNY